jgi:hypothetical protein
MERWGEVGSGAGGRGEMKRGGEMGRGSCILRLRVLPLCWLPACLHPQAVVMSEAKQALIQELLREGFASASGAFSFSWDEGASSGERKEGAADGEVGKRGEKEVWEMGRRGEKREGRGWIRVCGFQLLFPKPVLERLKPLSASLSF